MWPFSSFLAAACSISIATALPSIITPNDSSLGNRVKYNFNPGWKAMVGDIKDAEKVTFDDASWKSVSLPWAWNEDDAFRLDIANLSTGVAWYRKTFQVPAKDRKVFLEFEGIRHGGEFYVNGQWVGRHENGVMAFGFDVSNYIMEGVDNVVAARIDNNWLYREVSTNSRYQWNDKNFYANYGGINKNVYLHIADKLHQTLPLYSNLNTTGVYVYATDIDIPSRSATITAKSQVRNAYNETKTVNYKVVIKNLDGKLVGAFDGGSNTLAPNETKDIEVSSKLSGLSFWSWGYGYLYTVQTILLVDGKAIDTVNTVTGFRKTNFENGLFKLNDRTLQVKGYAQRSTNEWPALGSSVPAWLSDFSNQLVLESNGNLVRWMHVTPWKQDVESLDRLGIMQAMPAGDSEGDVTGRQWKHRVELMRDAIIYNRNNPSVIFYESGNNDISEEHMQEMKDLRNLYDPHGGRAAGARNMMGSSVAEYGGEMLYINKGKRFPFWSMEYSRDESQRVYWDGESAPYHQDGAGPVGQEAAYNRNQDSFAVEDAVRWFDYYEQRPGTGERVNSGGVNIVFSDSNTHHRGAENYRRSGEVDALRIPKEGWYSHKVMWDNWVELEREAIHLIGHWNYNQSTVKEVTVISTAERVELVRNGKSLGDGKQTSRFVFKFPNVTWEAGELKAIGYSSKSKAPVAIDQRLTIGEAVAIKLTPHVSPAGFLASGSDIALIDVEVVDRFGRRVPIALNTIDFKLSGEAEWRGGIAVGRDDNYILNTSLPVAGGINRVLLRSTTTPGRVELVASAEGLKSASLTLHSTLFETQNGLSLVLPANKLQSNLCRGPTPEGSSVKLTRRTVHIKSATAGSISVDPKLSYDDNETTTWSSSTTQSEAWIRYELEEELPTVNMVLLKLGGHRTSKYTLNVTVDDRVVWSGETPANLGYVTLPFNATKASNITLAANKPNHALRIVEVEIYGPV